MLFFLLKNCARKLQYDLTKSVQYCNDPKSLRLQAKQFFFLTGRQRRQQSNLTTWRRTQHAQSGNRQPTTPRIAHAATGRPCEQGQYNDYLLDTTRQRLQAKGQPPQSRHNGLTTNNREPLWRTKPNRAKALQSSALINFDERTPTSGSIDSGQVINRLGPWGRAMIPSSGIMLSPGDRCDSNPSATSLI